MVHTPFCFGFLLTRLFLIVPVVAIFTKFDDLITQVYDAERDEQQNRQVAETELKKKFRVPLDGFKFPPRAHVRTEGVSESCLLTTLT
jgi:hypothetical protein